LLGHYGFWDNAQFCEENRPRLCKLHGHDFPVGATGPFGETLDGDWLDYRVACKALRQHRRNYFRCARELSYGFWCDWHAAL
jgi:hypothetical protein